MSAVNDILGRLPIEQLADQLGSDPETIKQASTEAIESLMGGLQRNSSDALGQRSLAAALKTHTASPLLAGNNALDLNQIDQADGAKIVQHALGTDPATAAQNVRGQADKSLIQRLLPIIAPLVLAYLASRLGNQQIEAGRAQQGRQPAQSGGSILDAILGRAGGLDAPSANQEYQRGYQDGYNAAREELQQQGGMNLGDLIGGMMGGGQPQQRGSGLGGLLGGLFS